MAVILFLQVNTNGVLSFRSPFFDFSPDPFPLFDNDVLIAPFWDDINVNQGGQILFRLSEDQSLLNAVGSTINAAFNSGFSPGLLVIATWVAVPEFGSPNNVIGSFHLHSYTQQFQGCL